MKYKTYMPRDMTVGQKIGIDNVNWFVLERCQLIGSLINEGTS